MLGRKNIIIIRAVQPQNQHHSIEIFFKKINALKHSVLDYLIWTLHLSKIELSDLIDLF